MSFNGSGTFSPSSPSYPAVAGTLIEADKFNTIIADIANGLNLALTRDGQGIPTANLPMGNFRHTGVADGNARDTYATIAQLQDYELNWIDPSGVTGSANAIALAIAPSPTAYESGQFYSYVVENENTSEDVTHNVNSLGAVNTKKFYGGVKVKLAIGDLQIGMIAKLQHDGTDFILLNPRGYAQGADVASAATIDLDAVTGDLVDVTGTVAITGVTLRRGQQRTIRFTGILSFTHGANLLLPGAATITTAAGDFAVLRGYAAGVVRCVSYVRAAIAPLSFADYARLSMAQSWTKAQASTPVLLTDAATIAVDASLGNVMYVTLGGNRTLGQPTNPTDGQNLTIFITQDGVGNRTLAYHTDWLFPSGTDPVLSTGAGKVDILSAVYRGTKWYGLMNKDFL